MIRVTKIPITNARYARSKRKPSDSNVDTLRVTLVNLLPPRTCVGIHRVYYSRVYYNKKRLLTRREEKKEGKGGRRKEGRRKTEGRKQHREGGSGGGERSNSMRLVQCESSRGKLARGCCSRFPDFTTLNKLPMQI